ncbi:MAG TPA: DUF2062 domain-containing protein [Paracoccus sp. (in: a-proteobacteria)]|uniref:DUF2062 domain-containing protein n=1 Tax=uncultured Paracoccus sp. TaxID=189685 RepID=UPI002624D061|nr:DUF2062 domain-containing protein [uncultured Paracoccus sp.]HMQ41446.1 DUF2062 domain-containing protein [Paracoccus sp. (in: a-proteobacteria)]HMR37327.1 DUF2062 domain-containing protein [Paracoccus sp. (in: a-proteobacteria)]
MFKRRKPRSYSQIATEMIYPRGGWLRAGQYVLYRLRRLPDQPHKIGRGVAAGVFISFTPLHGLHFLAAAGIAWVIGGNILASLLATFVGNPITFPFIAYASTWLGRELLGTHGRLSAKKILNESADASMQVWHNFTAMFGHGTPHWDRLGSFYHDIYQPYMVGGLILGIIAAVVAHYLTVPVIRAYHRRRARKLAKRIERIRSVGTPPAKPQAGPRPDDPPP